MEGLTQASLIWHILENLAKYHRKKVQNVCCSYLEVVKDVADERDVGHPALQRAFPRLLTLLELLLQAVEQVPPKHGSIVLLGLSLDDGIQ